MRGKSARGQAQRVIYPLVFLLIILTFVYSRAQKHTPFQRRSVQTRSLETRSLQRRSVQARSLETRSPQKRSLQKRSLQKLPLYHLVVLHTNDTHGHPVKFSHYPGSWAGGLPARAALVGQIRRENKQPHEHVLVLDAGDLNTGRAESDFFKAKPDLEGYNFIGYDAMVLGNHEFDNPREVLKGQMNLAHFPFLSANIKTKNGEDFAQPYLIREFDGFKVAIFGLTAKETKYIANPEYVKDLMFEDEVKVAKRLVPELRKQVDVVIGLVHMGIFESSRRGSRRLAAEVSGIDLIVDGHSHTKLDKPILVKGPAGSGHKTIIVQAWQWGLILGRVDLWVKNREVIDYQFEAIPIRLKAIRKKSGEAQAYVYQRKFHTKAAGAAGADAVGAVGTDPVGAAGAVKVEAASSRLQCVVGAAGAADAVGAVGAVNAAGASDAGGRKSAAESQAYRIIGKAVDEDSELCSLLQPYVDRLNSRLSEIIGHAEEMFLNRTGIEEETALGDIVADSMLWYARKQGVESGIKSGVDSIAGSGIKSGIVSDIRAGIKSSIKSGINADIDFAIQNGGGIRVALPQGQVTRSLIHEMLPFDNSVVILTLHGSDVQSLFNFMATTIGRGAFPQVSEGLSFTINQGSGKNLRAGKSENILINGNPIDPNRIYKMATNSYLAAGGDGYKVLLKAVDRNDTSMFQRDVLIEYIKYLGGKIRPKVKGRITIIKNNKTRQSPRKYQKTLF